MILPKASCEECRSATQKIEDVVLRQIFKGFRLQHHMPSRRKPPDTLPLWLLSPDGSTDNVPVALNEHPGTLALPVFEPPGLLDGKPAERQITVTIHVIIRNPNRLTALAEQHRNRAIQIGMANLAVFERFIEKIAHGVVFTRLMGFPDGFTPLLPRLICAHKDETMNLNYFAGCPTTDLLPPENVLHSGRIHIIEEDGVQYLVADLRLFAWLSTPLYRILVAEKSLR